MRNWLQGCELLAAAGIRIVLPYTETPSGTRLAYIEGPDDVLIELVQPA